MSRFCFDLLLVIVSLMTLSCATSSCPKAGVSGIVETRNIKDDFYFVSIAEKESTSRPEMVNYFHQQAREFCAQNGFSDCKVISSGPVRCISSLYLPFIFPFLPLPHFNFFTYEHIRGESGNVECLKTK